MTLEMTGETHETKLESTRNAKVSDGETLKNTQNPFVFAVGSSV